ncbi:pilus assembly protein TadG-related protein [Streptomyces sp. NBC_01460]|uniref:pilus assembly protein TadG-related protein n=1 Tax=Streptomyces sp. NBC_01460 TaxID=2903875 RepID=UPI002E327484|nr:pilus assembly protein TadG-related protein [Streptomyces sp. NBC_01460]
MAGGFRGDRGQAFPIYVVMVVGLLFVAFAFFAVGQAAATRNGAQGAADAAALAAAQDARDGMGPEFLAALRTPEGLDQFLREHRFYDECGSAGRLAAANKSDVRGGCSWDYGYLQDAVTVNVETRNTVGGSVIPGTEDDHATADATAVIEFRCSPKPDDIVGALVTLSCDGRGGFGIDLAKPDRWSVLVKTLFAVHLIDR